MRLQLLLSYLSVVFLSSIPPSMGAGRLNIVQFAPDDTWVHYFSIIYKVLDGSKSLITLDDTTKLSDGQVIQLAFEAWEEMATIHDTSIFGDRPFVMTALQVMNEIYFSSSLKHNYRGFMAEFPDSCASTALERCSAASAQDQVAINAKNKGDTHRMGGNCGEPGAVHLFCRHHGDLLYGALPQPARIVAVAKQKDGNDMFVMNPCEVSKGYPNTWGCSRFLNDLNIRPITNAKNAEPIPADWNFY